jgi:hypothetical protein
VVTPTGDVFEEDYKEGTLLNRRLIEKGKGVPVKPAEHEDAAQEGHLDELVVVSREMVREKQRMAADVETR